MEEDVDFIESLERDANSKSNPCWTARDGATRCLPAAYVVGAWQSGGEELGERLQMALGKENVVARAPHFWNEHTETLERYASTWDRDAFGVDASPGTLATSWSESMRFHRAHAARVEKCWKACQELSNAYEGEDEPTPSEEEDARRRGSARASPRRRCVDGTTDDPKSGCLGAANALDPFEENGGHGLGLPHLMRAAYGDTPHVLGAKYEKEFSWEDVEPLFEEHVVHALDQRVGVIEDGFKFWRIRLEPVGASPERMTVVDALGEHRHHLLGVRREPVLVIAVSRFVMFVVVKRRV